MLYDAQGFPLKTKSVSYDYAEDTVTVQQAQDVAPIVKACQDDLASFNGYGDGRRVAYIPNILIDEYFARTGINLLKAENRDKLVYELNYGSLKPFKTVPGRVGK